MNDPYYSPTEEEIAKQMRASRRKFSNRFVPMNTYHDAMERIEALEGERDALKRELDSVRNGAQAELRDTIRSARDEATWQRIQGDDYGSF